MPVKFKAVAKRNPSDVSAAPKYYASAVATGQAQLKALSKKVAQESTVSEADAFAVIKALVSVMKNELSDGRIVRLDDLGSFQISVSSEGKDEASQVTATSIKKAKINYRPAKEIKDMLLTLSYEKS